MRVCKRCRRAETVRAFQLITGIGKLIQHGMHEVEETYTTLLLPWQHKHPLTAGPDGEADRVTG